MRGWDKSADAWVATQGEQGDFVRQFVLDPVMTERISGRGFANALDVGCGEGRFCRVLSGLGVAPIGIDPTEALLSLARSKAPGGDYRLGRAEDLPFADERFDLVVSYLSLIDIPDFETAITEMARVLKPGGTLMIANLNAFITAHAGDRGWVKDESGRRLYFAIDRYLESFAVWERWAGIEIENWHRPLSAYMQALLRSGLQLVHFDEPAPIGGPEDRVRQYLRVPYAFFMEWWKPTSGRIPG